MLDLKVCENPPSDVRFVPYSEYAEIVRNAGPNIQYVLIEFHSDEHGWKKGERVHGIVVVDDNITYAPRGKHQSIDEPLTEKLLEELSK